MGRILSNRQISEIEKSIDEIIHRSETLEPSNPTHVFILEHDEREMSRLLCIVEASMKAARIKESGLRLVS